jgi:polysaccharide biosynthesis protein PslH
MVASLAPYVVRFTREHDFDLIHIEDVVIAPIFEVLPEHTRRILFFHNLLSLQYRRLIETRATVISRLVAFIEYLWIRRFEKRMLISYQHAVVLTRIEKEHARRLNRNTQIREISLAVDTTEYRPDNSLEEYPSIVFSGTMSYPPNEEAVQFFLRYVFPKIVLKYPKIKFYVAGRNPSEKLAALSDENVIITGEVEDILQYISKCSVFVVPLLNGGGMRFKILEAFALAKAVVSTPIGAQGINYVEGENILIAPDADSFVKKVCFLLGDSAAARRQGEKARKLVEMHYCQQVVSSKWENFYRNLIRLSERRPAKDSWRSVNIDRN